MKRILINGLAARQGGGKTYLFNLLKDYKHKDLSFFLIIHQAHLADFSALKNVTIVTSKISENNLFVRFLWENIYLPYYLIKNKIDILFSPSGILPKLFLPKNCQYVTVSQNMLPFSPKEMKTLTSWKMRVKISILKYSQLFSFYKSDLIIFISNNAKNIILNHSLLKLKGGIDNVVIPHGIPKQFRAEECLDTGTEYSGPYALYVSSFFEYKSHLEVISAWREFKMQTSSSMKLLFLGDYSTPYGRIVKKEVNSLGLDEEIILLGNIDYQKLPNYYHHAKVIIFASRCENCPNILLESMASGRPIICSDYQPMPEFALDTVNYFNPRKPEELTALLLKYVNENTPQNFKNGVEALKLSSQFTWKQTQQKTWEKVLSLLE